MAPGCGEPNPDSYNYNPYQTKKQRGEIEKRMLLEKCPPETIALDATLLGKLDADRVEGFEDYFTLTFHRLPKESLLESS